MNEIVKKTVDLVVAKSPEILSGSAIVGVGATAILSARAGVRSQEAIADAEVAKMDALGLKEIPELDVREKLAATWRIWAPPAVACLATAGCIIGSNRVSNARAAQAMQKLAAATAYGLLMEQSYDDIKAAVIEKVGPEAYEEVKNGIAERKVERHVQNGGFTDTTVPDYAVDEYTLFFDPVTQREFWARKSDMLSIITKHNERIREGEFVPINDIYEDIQLSPSSKGEEWGFSLVTTGYIDYEFGWSETPSGRPCCVLTWTPDHKYRYYYGG